MRPREATTGLVLGLLAPVGLRADERRLERFRRALPRSCWALPDPWPGPALAPPPLRDPDPDPVLRGFADPSTPADRRRAVPRAVCVLQA